MLQRPFHELLNARFVTFDVFDLPSTDGDSEPLEVTEAIKDDALNLAKEEVLAIQDRRGLLRWGWGRLCECWGQRIYGQRWTRRLRRWPAGGCEPGLEIGSGSDGGGD